MKKLGILLAIFFITSISMKAQLDAELLKLQGHRGARGLYPENTVGGFIKTLDLGVYTMELDVVMSQDGEIVVSHEPYFSSTICLDPSGKSIGEEEMKNHSIYQMPYTKVKTYDCGSIGNERFPQQEKKKSYKPLLKEVIAAVDAHAAANDMPSPIYNIEIKSKEEYYDIHQPQPSEFVSRVVALLKELGIEKRVVVQSFDPNILIELNKQSPDLLISYLVENLHSLKKNLSKIDFIPDFYSPYYKLITQKLISNAHEKGIKVVAWTVNDIEKVKKLYAKGVDAIITDYPNFKADLTD